MLYSSAGILALIVHIIINHDVFRRGSDREIIPSHRLYRAFLLAAGAYFVTDILWGILYEQELDALVWADTAVYFAAMACSVLLWTRFAVSYLKEKKDRFGTMLETAGWVIFVFQMGMILVNIFSSWLYYIDDAHVYHAGFARYLTLGAQVVMYETTAGYALNAAARKDGNRTMRLRNRTIGFSSLAMGGFIILQFLFPLLPMYAVGCMLSTCVLHSFVLENEKEEYREQLETRLKESILNGNYYDLLTGLPGMSYFFQLTEARRADMFRRGEQAAVLYMNLCGMKFYNQEQGFTQGDRVLQSFAGLLTAAFGEEACSRFGQDHFVAFSRQEALEETLEKLFRDWEAVPEGKKLPIRVGIYPDSSDRVSLSSACDRAKLACDAIRNSYVSSMRFFDTAMQEDAELQQYIIGNLDRAIAEGHIRVYYQPIVRAIGGHVCDEEALARWIDPERGFMSPAEFIPVLENASLIYKLDLFMVDQVLEKMHTMEAHHLPVVPQSVNLSRSDFDSCDIVEEIRRRVDRSGYGRNLLNIEITESTIGKDFEFMNEQIRRFRELGFRVWMDDFGSGYSSLDVLQSTQLDLIKFDMRFMQQFSNGSKDKIILTELIKMAVSLGIDTVCEGVEREEQAEFLRMVGCARLQGYHYARPMPLEQILERYQTGTQIGFEKPEESGYYDVISQVNLYDLSIIAQEDENNFRHYFNTLPMAVIEVQGTTGRFTRYNQAYLDFMARMLRTDISGKTTLFREMTLTDDRTFNLQLLKCVETGGRFVIQERTPDGHTVHSVMRRIAVDEHSGRAAVAVAVLEIGGLNTEEKRREGE